MLPSSVRIGCYDYKVFLTKNPIIVDNKLCIGAIRYIDNEIYISDSLSEQMQEQTLWHEMLHGIINYFKLDDSDITFDDECAIDNISMELYNLLRNNEWLPGMKKVKKG